MRLVLVSLCSALLLTGCLSGYHIPREHGEEKIAAAMEVMKDRTVVVTDVQGNEIRLDSVELLSEALLGVSHETGVTVGLSRDSIQRLDVWVGVDKRWISSGVIAGAATGAVFGAIVSAAWAGDYPGLTISGASAVVGVMALGGALMGGVLGAIPREYRYRFEGSASPTIEKTRQPPKKTATRDNPAPTPIIPR